MSSPLEIFRPDVLAGRVALVTGGGSGICKGIAAAYRRFGAEVCIVGRKADRLAETAAEIGAFPFAGDVRKPDDLAAAIAATIEKFGKLDTLVNGAAGNFLSPAAALSPNGFKTVVEIDLCGTFNASRAAFEHLQRAGDALILNISATLHYHGTPMQVHASAAKAGVDAVTRNLAVEWGRFGVRVCGLAPGPIGDTEGMKRLAPPGDLSQKMKSAIPAGRFGNIDEIAAAAVYLRSAAAAYITGHVLVVDGGQCVAVPGLI
jgi:2,4-dienoyl-CoA reductase [(3E)-enoyl-CoA-producing], peroxisomal